MFPKLPSLLSLPTFTATFTARLTASLFFLLFCLTLKHFSYDHFGKATAQMQTFLIEQNTVRMPQEAASGFYYYNNNGEGEFRDFEDDGEEDYELYNDEDYYAADDF